MSQGISIVVAVCTLYVSMWDAAAMSMRVLYNLRAEMKKMNNERGAETHPGKVLKCKARRTFHVKSAERKAESEAEWF